jgi:hypothetical protein
MVYFFDSGSVTELAACMRNLYFNIDKRFELIKNANTFNENFNWLKQKQLLYQLIDK